MAYRRKTRSTSRRRTSSRAGYGRARRVTSRRSSVRRRSGSTIRLVIEHAAAPQANMAALNPQDGAFMVPTSTPRKAKL